MGKQRKDYPEEEAQEESRMYLIGGVSIVKADYLWQCRGGLKNENGNGGGGDGRRGYSPKAKRDTYRRLALKAIKKGEVLRREKR